MDRRHLLGILGVIGLVGVTGAAPKARPTPGERWHAAYEGCAGDTCKGPLSKSAPDGSELRMYSQGLEWWQDGHLVAFQDEQGFVRVA